MKSIIAWAKQPNPGSKDRMPAFIKPCIAGVIVAVPGFILHSGLIVSLAGVVFIIVLIAVSFVPRWRD